LKENAARPVRGSFTARRVTGEKASGMSGKSGPNAAFCEERDCAVALQQAIASSNSILVTDPQVRRRRS
jgi:hypothetical protein